MAATNWQLLLPSGERARYTATGTPTAWPMNWSAKYVAGMGPYLPKPHSWKARSIRNRLGGRFGFSES